MWAISELRDVADPAWPTIQDAIAAADHEVKVLPVHPAQGENTLFRLQVTARSYLGALALHTGGLLIDSGWLRMLGGGDPPFNLAVANGLHTPPDRPALQLLVAFDILGGKFAINGGALPGEVGEVCYYAPDQLAWLPMEMGYGSFVAWSMTNRLAMFNEHLRWPGWENEARALGHDQGLSMFPFPFTREGRDLSIVSRRPVAISELLTFWEHLAQQMGNVHDGEAVVVRVDDARDAPGPETP